MSYQVIARKYRPQRFADVVGQEHVTQTLSNAILQNRIAHAYLFCGPRGTGKTTIARIFAKCLNCTGGPKVDFDDADSRCVEITEGRALDVFEIDGASNNGVEQVRELRDTVRFAPASSRFKIYIIDEVHMLTTAAFNALLKTLEEPPAHVKFLFATTDPEKVLATILSRCQRFDLRRIPVALIVRHLAQISAQEKVQVSEAALHAIARGADGGMRDAESALDQLISFCGTKIEEDDVLSMFGLTSHAQVLGIAMSILRGDAAGILRELDTLARHGKDLTRLLADVIGHFRNLLVYRVSGGDLGLLEVSETEAASLKEHSEAAQSDALTRILEILSESEGRMRESTSKKIFVEIAFFKAMQARNAVGLDAVLKQLKELRSGAPTVEAAARVAPATTVATATPATSSRAPQPTGPSLARAAASPVVASAERASSSSPAPASPAPQPAPSAPDSLDTLWTQLLEGVGRVSQFTRSYLIEAFPVSLPGQIFTIGFDPEFAG
ncbi:MAG: DNA polymerase III subunit gamma/tau, partial [Verrucomicrobia bacterium]|nr:DNA polymerase III subunit gamma/tau [Verrucomicrobiota bacterium]